MVRFEMNNVTVAFVSISSSKTFGKTFTLTKNNPVLYFESY